MTPEALSTFKLQLEHLLDELDKSADTADAAARPVQLDQQSVGRLSRMDAMQGQAMAIENQRRRKLHRMRIRQALARIDNGDYGIYQACDEEVDLRRLKFDPAAVLCIACADAREAH